MNATAFETARTTFSAIKKNVTQVNMKRFGEQKRVQHAEEMIGKT